MACVSTHELVSVGDTLPGSQAWKQTWTMCSVWSGEEAEDGQAATSTFLEYVPHRKDKALWLEQRGGDIRANNQYPPRNFYFQHIHHALWLNVANFQKGRLRQRSLITCLGSVDETDYPLSCGQCCSISFKQNCRWVLKSRSEVPLDISFPAMVVLTNKLKLLSLYMCKYYSIS